MSFRIFTLIVRISSLVAYTHALLTRAL